MGNIYKKRVIPISISDFRQLFNLNEIRDPKTGKVLQPSIYENSKDINPKQGEQRPWTKGDEPLFPFEEETKPKDKRTPAQKIHANEYYDSEYQELSTQTLLSRYLTKREVTYYMAQIRKEAKQCKDSWTQVIQVIQEKEKQRKFMKGTKQYKRNAIIDYVLKENLKDYGWSIVPPTPKKDRKRDPELFESLQP